MRVIGNTSQGLNKYNYSIFMHLANMYGEEIIGSDSSFSKIQNVGAQVSQLRLKEVEIFRLSERERSLSFGLPIMIPYADLVKNAEYKFKGRVYYLPRNASAIGNINDSIHGLTRNLVWSTKARGNNHVTLEVKFRDPGYPSEMMAQVKYTISRVSFDIEIKLKNIGDRDAPFVIGAHPYFKVQQPWRLYHKYPIKKLNYPDRIFPDGTLLYYNFNEIDNPGKKKYDDSFVGGGRLKLESSHSYIFLERRNMDYFEVYNGKFAGMQSVALEPMTGAINAFNNGIGLKSLSPNQEFECGFKITVCEKE